MQEQFPLVSVVIPTYRNRGNLIRAIDSVLNQSYPNIEVIVVDDNNPDDKWRKSTEEVLANFHDDKRVVYLKHPYNKNGAAARNTGIFWAHGAFIALLDDDDYFKPSKLAEQVEYLNRHPEYQAAYCKCEHSSEMIDFDLPNGNLGKEILLLKTKLYTPSLIFRVESIKKINGFDERFKRHQDYELMLRFFGEGFQIGAVQKPLTVIGANNGENRLDAISLEKLKKQFLEKFEEYIQAYVQVDKQYRNKVLARNYYSVFLAYIKERKFFHAIRIMTKYSWRSPYHFFNSLLGTIKYHLNKR